MALNTQLDSAHLKGAALPYNKILRQLDTSPHIVDGTNTLATLGGKLIKRPGITAIASTSLSYRIDRLWVYETLDSPQRIYILASAFTGTFWEMFYIRLGVTSWTTIGTLRSLQQSLRPHEVVTARGLAFIKGFPGGSEFYGSVLFNGASVYTTFWGYPPPTSSAKISGTVRTLVGSITASATSMTLSSSHGVATPFYVSIGEEDILIVTMVGSAATVMTRAQNGTIASAHSSGADVLHKNWTSTYHQVTVDLGWRYTYAYKTRSGHITSRAPLETNPDRRPSDTGAFTDVIPKVDVTGIADTTNIPTIVMYRTTDGGGAFYKLEEIPNTGAATIQYLDDQLTSDGGNQDPQPDELLDSANVAPSLTSNLPPPPVAPPKLAGSNAIEGSSPLAYYSHRIWYWINNYLFYSGDEEITEGIPEESFYQAGLEFGNNFRAKHAGVNVHATTEALYAWTAKDTYVVRGNDRKTFQFDKLISGIGMASGHPRAVTSVGDKVIWLTQDFRIVAARGDAVVVLSDELGRDIINLLGANTEIELHYFAELEKEYIVVNVIDKATPANTRQFFYDIKLSEANNGHFWNCPWTITNSAAISDRVFESDQRRYLLFYNWNGSTGSLCKWDSTETVVQDVSTNYAWNATFNVTEAPTGNHVNSLRQPHLASAIYGFALERTKFTSDTDPTLVWYKDDLWTTPSAALTAVTPARRAASLGYSTLEYKLNDAVQRVAIKLSKDADNQRFELQTLTYTFNPDGGA